jgi:hypothetical protein
MHIEDFDNDEKYPLETAADGEEVYDNEIFPLLERAHKIAARSGIPITTFALYSPGYTGSTVTVKNPALLTAPLLVAIILNGGANHPRASEMLAAAVAASEDPFLAALFTDLMLDLFAAQLGLDLKGMDREQRVGAAVGALLDRESENDPNPQEVM